jgi:DNA-binding transcriptional LysR family regulator
MLFRQLEYLVALSRERHFANAARSCGVSQPSLSEGILKLEEELQIPLIQRGRRFSGLTAEGERVVLWALRVLADRDALTDEVAAMRTGLTGRVRIGTVPTASTAVTRLVEPLCVQHPLLDVQVLSSLTSRDIFSMLQDFAIDAGLTYADSEVPAACRVLPLYREKHVLLTTGAAGGADLGGGPVSWAEAAALPLCLLMPSMRGRRILDAAFAEVGAVPSARVEADSLASLVAHVATGRWAGIVSLALLHTLGVPPGVRAIPMAETAQAREIGLVTLRRDPEPVMVRALVGAARGADLRALEHLPVRGPGPGPGAGPGAGPGPGPADGPGLGGPRE